MTLLFLLLGLAQARTQSLAEVGEKLAGIEVVDVFDHNEFQRITVRLEDGRDLQVEASRSEPGAGACHHHGLSLFPRWELLDESVDVEDQPEVIRVLCERLDARGEDLAMLPRKGKGLDHPSDGGASELEPGTGLVFAERPTRLFSLPRGEPEPTPLSWVLPLGLLFTLVAGAWTLTARRPSRRDLAELGGITLLSLGLRLALSPHTVYWGPAFGYSRLTTAWGLDTGPQTLYGGGLAALVGPLSHAWDHSPEALFTLHLAMGTLAAPLAWGVARSLLGPGRWGPLVAGLLMATLPTHLRLSASEAQHIDVLTIELAAVCATLFITRTTGLHAALWAAAAALFTGFVAHLRPEALAFAVVPAAWLVPQARKRELALGIATMLTLFLTVPRVIDLMTLESTAVQQSKWIDPDFWIEVLLPQLGTPGAWNHTNTALSWQLTTPALAVLAVFGLTRSWRTAWLVLWLTVTMLPVLPKSWPLVDAMRLQLPGMAPLVVLAAVGVAQVRERWSLTGPVVAVVTLLTTLPYLPGVTERWAVHEEFAWLVQTLPTLEEGTVLYDDASPHADGFARWANNQAPNTYWVGMGAASRGTPVSLPLYAYLGVSCALQDTNGREAPPNNCSVPTDQGCTEVVVSSAELGSRTDVDVQLDGPVTVWVAELRDCPQTPPPEQGSPPAPGDPQH